MPGLWIIEVYGHEVDMNQGPQPFALTWSYTCTDKVLSRKYQSDVTPSSVPAPTPAQ